MSGDYNWVKPVQTLPNLQIGQSLDWREVGSVPENNEVKNAYDENYLWKEGEEMSREWFQTDSNLEDDEISIDGEIIKDISDEEFRHYIFGEGSVMILFPIFLYVDEETGQHQIMDRECVLHTINSGWMKFESEFFA